MSGLGFGLGNGGSDRQVSLSENANLPCFLNVFPGVGWDGTVGSGFSAREMGAPFDPERSTAKPAMRLMLPPNQFFTDEIVVGVLSAANYRESLLDNLGLAKVVVHFEGERAEILEPGFHYANARDGSRRAYLGWWATLRKPAGKSGHAHVYFEAVPKDQTMQNRVIGPLQFSLQDAMHDWSANIAADGSGDFLTVAEAIGAAKAANADNPLCNFVQSGTYDLAAGVPNYQGQGYLTFTCDEGIEVTFAKQAFTSDGAALSRTRWNGMWFRGQGFTFDFANMASIYHDAQTNSLNAFSGRSHVFEGCRMTNSAGRYDLWRKGGRPHGWLVWGSAWFLECTFDAVLNPGMHANLYRGCEFKNGWFDCMNGAAAAVGNVYEDWHSFEWRTPIDACTVRYSGSAKTAKLALTGSSDGFDRTFTAFEDGVAVGSLTVTKSETEYIADTRYSVRNVVEWLEGLAGWSAVLLDDSRRATSLTDGSAGFGAFEIDVSFIPTTLRTAFDLHTDWYQAGNNTPHENVVIWGNHGWNLAAQFVMVGAAINRDYMIANNALAGHLADPDNPGFVVLKSQLAKAHSHTVLVHNSFATQALSLRTGPSSLQQFDGDAYCLINNNALADLDFDNAEDADVQIRANSLEGGNSGPDGAYATKSNGNFSDRFVDAGSGDLRPGTALRAHAAVPSLRWDAAGDRRGATAPAGAYQM